MQNMKKMLYYKYHICLHIDSEVMQMKFKFEKKYLYWGITNFNWNFHADYRWICTGISDDPCA